MNESDDFAVSAELLRRGRDVKDMVRTLASRLERALPDHVQFVPGRLGRPARLLVGLEPQSFRIEVHRQRLVTWIDHIVRGVCVRSDDVDVDEWFDRLAKALDREAKRSTIVRLALEESLS